LWQIFRRYAPAEVCVLSAAWDDDERRCVRLGIFPAELSARVVAMTAFASSCLGLCGLSLCAPDLLQLRSSSQRWSTINPYWLRGREPTSSLAEAVEALRHLTMHRLPAVRAARAETDRWTE
jgi:hypothetical protein